MYKDIVRTDNSLRPYQQEAKADIFQPGMSVIMFCSRCQLEQVKHVSLLQ